MTWGFDALLSPIILFFVLGAAAAFARSDLSVPEAVAKGMSLYLMAAIGLKGGVQVSGSSVSAEMLGAAAAGMALSFALPALAFALLRSVGRLDPTNAGAVAAHYGSVSVVTFVTATEALTVGGLPPAGYMVAVMALMETPAIVTGLLLARRSAGGTRLRGDLWRETVLNGSVVLLVGSFVIGLVAGKDGFAPIAPVFDVAFRGILCLFLLDMGLLAARRLQQGRALTARLVGVAVFLPVINGTIGMGVGLALGLGAGTLAVFAVLAASASYIAVPAAMRLALPQADPGVSLAMSLGIMFPVNIIFGIPLSAAAARLAS